MKVHFWGTRGSLPAAASTLDLKRKVFGAIKSLAGRHLAGDDDVREFLEKELPFHLAGHYGTNTPCVEIRGGTEHVICDAGTGIRDLSRTLGVAPDGDPGERVFNIFLSHLHWDHIQGFPFFMPAYSEGSRIVVYGGHPDMKAALDYQRGYSNMPLPVKADLSFRRLEPGRQYEIAGFQVLVASQNHPGDSYGYRFEVEGGSVVYSTDSEHLEEGSADERRFIEFFRNADLVIIDAQYPLLDAFSVKENWGHSNNIVAVELGAKAGVRRLVLFHNEPTVDDHGLETFLNDTRRYLEIYDPGNPMQIDLAYDGMEIEI
ncbi:MAG TPA: MBL fold metallo-hydrolase [Syntrophorhabdaceae bacterium]|nr:MBL fold metallo-hydrolase [Syntrophorhabdaceae bacterium]